MSRAEQWSWMRAFNEAHPYMTWAQVTGCAVDAGVMTTAERSALVRA